MDKRFLAILGGIIAIFIVIFAITQGSSNNNNNSSTNSNAKPTSHITGEGKKGVTLVEYGDYQCPVCALYNPSVDQVEKKYEKDIYYQFRNLPLTIHPNAYSAARAAEAAGLQGKYFQMHDLLYQNQSAWSDSSNPLTLFKAYAQQIGLNVNKFTSDYSSNQVNDAIQADLSAFAKTGQEQATPTFFLDGKPLNNQDLVDSQTGGPTLEKFSKIIDAEIAQKTQ